MWKFCATSFCRLSRLERIDARTLVDGLRGRSLLNNRRGATAADIAALIDLIVRVSHLAIELGDEHR